jgi:hemerythrin-like domain-containing protein
MNPLAQLELQHRRLERDVAALERLAAHVAQRGADRLAQSEAQALAECFNGVAAQHHEHEDRTLFPLLRQRAAAAGRTEVAAAIEELEREHGAMDGLWRRLRAALLDIAATKETRLPAEEVERFAWLYRRHMEREDLLILPFAREVLTAEDLAALRK